MKKTPIGQLAILCTALFLAMLSSGCADDATRMERAREFAAQKEYRAASIELKNILQNDAANAEARVLLGEISLSTGDLETAIKELKRARELGASPDQYTVALAKALLRDTRYQEVVSQNPDLLQDSAGRAALLGIVGLAEIERGNRSAAESSFSAALKLNPSQPDALIGRARLAQERGDLAAARESLDRLTADGYSDADAFAALARLQMQAKEYAVAETNFRKAVTALEGTGRAEERMVYTSGLIEAQLAQGKNAEAQTVAANMVTATAQHPLALFQAARADFAAKDFASAIEKANRIVTAHPGAEPAHMLIAASAIATQDQALAATHLQAAVNINPANEMARKLLAQTRMQMGDPDEALALLEPLIAAGTRDPQILTMAGTASIRSGDAETGLRLVEQGMQYESSDPAVALQAAANFLLAGELDRAVEVLNGLPDEERVGQRELLLILALLRKGDISGARAEAVSVVTSRPDAVDSHRLMGGFHLAVGELDDARKSFNKALQLDPDDIASVVNLARIEVAQDNLGEAQRLFEDMLKRKPGNLIALTGLAQLAERGGDVKEGVRLLERARKANPEALVPLLTLGRYYLENGNIELAAECAEQAVRAAPGNAEAQTLRGVVMTQDGRPSEAIVVLERALAANPKLALAHYHLGRAQLASGREDDAYDSFRRATELDKTFFPAPVALIAAEVRRGNLNAALAQVDDLAKDYPARSEPLMLRGDVHIARKDFNAALASYEQATAIRPSRAIAAKLAELKRRLGRDRPWADLESWVKDNPDDNVAHALLGQLFHQAGMTERAVASYSRAMELSPNAIIATRLAMIQRDAGKLDDAAASLENAIKLDPKEIAARAALASVELERGKTDRALKLVRELATENPNDAEVALLQGDVLLKVGNYNGSIDAYDRAGDLQPTERTALKRYEARRQAGRDDAWRVLESWHTDHPGHVNAGILLAQDYAGRDWYDEAITAYRRVLATEPNNLIALNNIAWVYINRRDEGDLLRAVNSAEKAYGQNQDLAAVGDTYGWALVQTDQAGKALPILRKAATAADADAEIRYHFAAALAATGGKAEAVTVLDKLLAGNTTFDSRKDAETLRRSLSP